MRTTGVMAQGSDLTGRTSTSWNLQTLRGPASTKPASSQRFPAQCAKSFQRNNALEVLAFYGKKYHAEYDRQDTTKNFMIS